MTIAEIQKEISLFSLEEQETLAAYLKHLSRSQDPEYQAVLNRKMDRIDQGHKVRLEQLTKAHEYLSAQDL